MSPLAYSNYEALEGEEADDGDANGFVYADFGIINVAGEDEYEDLDEVDGIPRDPSLVSDERVGEVLREECMDDIQFVRLGTG